MTRSLLDAPAPERTSLWPVVFTVGAHVLIAAAVGAVVIRPQVVGQVAALAEFIDIEVEPEPPPPAPEPEIEQPVQVSPRVQPKPEPRPAQPAPEPPAIEPPAPEPPAAAQAAQALTQESDVVDLSNTIVVGSGSKYGGGTTDPNGTSAGPVRALGARGAGAGVAQGAPVAPSKPAPSLARAPRLAGGASWSCPFPPEADVADVNQATVALRVSVGANGSVSDVSVSSEPGYGFGRAAKRCAMSKRWDPGLDATGRAVGAVAVVNVRFVR